MIFTDFSKAFSQILDPRFLGVLARSLGLTLLLLAGLGWGVLWVLPDSVSLPFWGEVVWLSKVLSGFALVSVFIMSAFLMIPVASLFIGFFLERIAAAVERRHYPDLPPATPQPLADIAIDGLKFTCLLIFANLVALIVYVLSTVLAPFIFWIVNGILLSREYFQLVAMRRLGRKRAQELHAKHRIEVWIAGILMAVPLTVPLVNLFVPVLGVATFTHIFHRLNK